MTNLETENPAQVDIADLDRLRDALEAAVNGMTAINSALNRDMLQKMPIHLINKFDDGLQLARAALSEGQP